MSRLTRSAAALAAAVVTSLVVASCGSDEPSAGAADTGADGDRLTVLAAFYPLEFAAERVGGDRVEVGNLTAPGAEPHDLELTPQDVGRISDVDLIVFLEGFQPAVDEAVGTEGGDAAFDVHEDARLDLTAQENDAQEDEAGHEDEEAQGHEGTDPHFWLDPLRLADVADAIAERLGEIDADGAEEYQANAAELRSDLEALDGELSDGLSDCAITDLVSSHTAFGYLADRYGFTQVGISGLTTEDEPSSADLARLTDFVTEHGVTTIYSESLASPELAETVATETGATTAVLDPLEGLGDDAAGDYLGVMRANLEVLQAGQSCT